MHMYVHAYRYIHTHTHTPVAQRRRVPFGYVAPSMYSLNRSGLCAQIHAVTTFDVLMGGALPLVRCCEAATTSAGPQHEPPALARMIEMRMRIWHGGAVSVRLS